jgi:hypothetical protein
MKAKHLVPTKELKLGDVIRSDHAGVYVDSTVVKIESPFVTLIRPFVHLADFTYTGGVMHYIGTEEWELPLSGDSEWTVLDNIFNERIL